MWGPFTHNTSGALGKTATQIRGLDVGTLARFGRSEIPCGDITHLESRGTAATQMCGLGVTTLAPSCRSRSQRAFGTAVVQVGLHLSNRTAAVAANRELHI